MSGPTPSPCGLDVAPYVLGALDPDEARAFVGHLALCAVCRDEVAALAQVLDVLPAGAAPRVRPALRRRVLRAVRREPKRIRRRSPIVFSAPSGWLALGLAMAAALVVGLDSSHVPRRVIRATVGHAELRVSGGHGELVVAHLAPLPASRVYELWVASPGRAPAPSALFAVSSRGDAEVNVAGNLHAASRLLVTVEPRGGGLRPSTRAVIQLPLGDVSRS